MARQLTVAAVAALLVALVCADSLASSTSPSCQFASIYREYYSVVELNDGGAKLVSNHSAGNYTAGAYFASNNRMVVFTSQDTEPRFMANLIVATVFDMETNDVLATYDFAGVPGTTVMTSIDGAVIPGANRESFVVPLAENRFVDSYNQVIVASLIVPANNSVNWGGGIELASTFNYNFYPQKSIPVGNGNGSICIQLVEQSGTPSDLGWNTYAVMASRNSFEATMNNSIDFMGASEISSDVYAGLLNDGNGLSVVSLVQDTSSGAWSAMLWGAANFYGTDQLLGPCATAPLSGLPTDHVITVMRAVLVGSTWQVMVSDASMAEEASASEIITIYLLTIDASTGASTQYGPYELPTEADGVYTDFTCSF